MAASKQEVYFIAIRMQVGAIRRELPVIGLCDQGRDTVLEALELVEAQVREWSVDAMVTVRQLQEALAALMRLPGELRIVKESGQDAHLSLEVLRTFGILPTHEEGGGGGMVN